MVAITSLQVSIEILLYIKCVVIFLLQGGNSEGGPDGIASLAATTLATGTGANTGLVASALSAVPGNEPLASAANTVAATPAVEQIPQE